MDSVALTNDINRLWKQGDRRTAIYTLHAQLHQIDADQVEPNLWSIYRERQDEFVRAWIDNAAIRFDTFIQDL